MKDPTFWMLARASGLLAYAALTAATLLGLLVKARPFRSLSRATVTDLHRFVALIRARRPVRPRRRARARRSDAMPVPALVIPGSRPTARSGRRPESSPAELLLLVIASFPLRRVIGAKTWRRLHWATYAMFALAAVHGIGSGTDTSRPWVMAFYAGTIGAVAAATVWRALVPPPRRVANAAPTKHIPETALEGALP